MALFYVNEKDELIPIAIQLFQEPKEDNPVSQWWKLWAMKSGCFNVRVALAFGLP